MAWAAQLHAVLQQHAWAAAVQTPGGVARQFASHQALLVALRTQQAGAAGGGAASAASGSSASEASSVGTAVDQGHKSLAEMRQERQVHPNMESVFRRTYSSPSDLPSAANSADKAADHEEEICKCVDCACVDCACGGLERGRRADNLAHCTLFCTLHFVLCLVADQELFCLCSV